MEHMDDLPSISFSPAHKWNISLSVAVSVLAALAIAAMVNYVAARHFARIPLSRTAQTALSPRTLEVLRTITNDVKVTMFYEKEEKDPLYDSVWALLKEYAYANQRIRIEAVDCVRDTSAAQLVKAKYRLNQPSDKNVVIFESTGGTHVVRASELSDLDLAPMLGGLTNEVKRTHFKGEVMFTSGLLTVTSLRSLKAYFLAGHGEHQPDNEDKLMGYSEFAGVLTENTIKFQSLALTAVPEVPLDCNLLIIAGPTSALLPEEVEKIERYLKQGGRLFVLFNYQTVENPIGLERLLADWGVAVGRNVLQDPENAVGGDGMVVSEFGHHALSRPLYKSRLYVLRPRSISKSSVRGASADSVTVETLASTGPKGRVMTDLRKGVVYPSPADYVGSVPLAVAVERGRLQGVSADRGATRMVVVGDSVFLGNETIPKLANRDFAVLAVNWLLDRTQLMGGLGPRPIKEYRLTMTRSEMATVQWVLLLGMPGSILLLGFLVSVRRRR
jgi:hypothetical protein